MTAYTEVIQDGMLDCCDSGKLRVASATAFSLARGRSPSFNDKSTTTASGSSCGRRRSATTPRSSAGSAASP